MKKSKQPNTPLLEVKNFGLHFQTFEKGLKEKMLHVIHELNMTIYPGEIVAVVGASGSGKSLLADAILGILPENAHTTGEITYKGSVLSKQRVHQLRGKEITLIPQSVNALDPLMKTGKQVQLMISSGRKKAIQADLFTQVGLKRETGNHYPFELSGGMNRRVLVATTLASEAQLIIADEPTPGMDPIALRETLAQLKQLVTGDKGMMFITHDIAAATQLADKIVVFRDGKTIDQALASDFSGKGEKLTETYTKELWNKLPQNDFINLSISSNKKMKKTDKAPLIVKNVCYSYDKAEKLLENVNVTINPGEVVGLRGPSGIGKSTLAKLIAGYLRLENGSVHIGDEDMALKRNYPVQLVWQHPEKAINPRWKMAKIALETGGLDDEIMTAFGLKKEWLKRWPSELSGGELQRFSLARALSSENCRYLIADEITTMLDSITQAKIWQTVLQITKQRQIGLLVISHDDALLQRLTDRMIDFKEITHHRMY